MTINLGQYGVTYENINVMDVEGTPTVYVNSAGVYQMMTAAKTAQARTLKKAVDELAQEYARSLPHLSKEARIEKAITTLFQRARR